MRSEGQDVSLPKPSGGDRKNSIAVGQSIYYTDYPQKEYGTSSGDYVLQSLSKLIVFFFIY